MKRLLRSLLSGLHYGSLLVLLFLTLFPFAMMLMLSHKEAAELFLGFWKPPAQFRWAQYAVAWENLSGYIMNSLIVSCAAVAFTVLLSSLAGYVFARLEFRGRNVIYGAMMALLMVPGILTLVPAFLWYKEFPLLGGNNWLGEGGQGLLNSRWALILSIVSTGQLLGIFLSRSFIEDLPESLFEAARLDGANTWHCYLYVALPLSRPMLATVGILTFIASYNDYVWPLVTISDQSRQVFSVGVTYLQQQEGMEHGRIMAGYVIGSLPLLLVIAVGMKYYIAGITQGSVKG